MEERKGLLRVWADRARAMSKIAPSLPRAERVRAAKRCLLRFILELALSAIRILGDLAIEEVSTDRYSFIHSCTRRSRNGYRLPLRTVVSVSYAKAYIRAEKAIVQRTTLDVRLLGGAFVFDFVF